MGGKKARKRGAGRNSKTHVDKEDLLRYVRKSADRGTNFRHILEDFNVAPAARKQIRDILNQLVKEGKLAKHRGSRYEAAVRNLVEGTILVHRDGYGFVIPKEKIQGIESDIYIPAALIGPAMNGDSVKVEITLHKPGGRAEGRVASVEKRARNTIVGQLRYDGQVFFVAPADDKLPEKILITNDAGEHKDKIVDVEVLPDGTFQLGVHIADVSQFVPADSAMDREARYRGTSVYFPDRVIPMLPEKVSNHLCSLNPKKDRLALSVVMHLSRTGEVLDYSFHRSVIHSKERMTYEDVQQILDGSPSLEERYAHIVPQLRTLERLAKIIQQHRRQRGAIDFDLPEPMLTYNESGDVAGIANSIGLFSNRIVEEFMILANEVVARHLEENEIPSLYR